MKLYTFKELFGTWGTPLHGQKEKDISQYAAELGDGWRFWTTIDMIVLPILLICYLTTELTLVTGIIIACIIVVLMPVLTTVGYIFGSLKKHASPRVLLRLATQYFIKYGTQ